MSHRMEAAQPRVVIHPSVPMLDTPLQIRLVAFPPHRAITLRMTMCDAFGLFRSAQAAFLTDEHGSVDVRSQAPIAGSYTGADPMGLIWSMTLVAEATAPAEPDHRVLPPLTMWLRAELNGQLIAETTFERLCQAPGTQRRVVRE
jgi:Acyl-CoA thioester hydrolase/BAAT N-terminal region